MVGRRQFTGVELTLIGDVHGRTCILLVRAVDARRPTFHAARISLALPASLLRHRGRHCRHRRRILSRRAQEGVLLNLVVDVVRQFHVRQLQQLTPAATAES